MIEVTLEWCWHIIAELWLLIPIIIAGFHHFMFLSMDEHGEAYNKNLTQEHIAEHTLNALTATIAGFLAAIVAVVHLGQEWSGGTGADVPIGSLWTVLENISFGLAALAYMGISKHLRLESLARLCERYFKHG